MTFKLQEFIASINTDGIARTHSFEVIIAPPPSLTELTPDKQKLLTLRCQNVQLPEIDFQTIQYYRKVVGPGEQRVMGINPFKVIPMEFIVDKNLKIREFFENWMQYIVNYGDWNHSNITVGTNVEDGTNFEDFNYYPINGNQYPYEISYKREYVASIIIKVYPDGLKVGDDYEPSKIYTLYNAYPVNMGNTDLNWGNVDRNMILPVGFTYDTIEMPSMVTS